MAFRENISIALDSIWANKLRSFLTMLGIIIGTAAVIGVVSIGQGGQSMIIQEIEGLGANLIIVFPRTFDDREGWRKPVLLRAEDIATIQRIKGLAACSPEISWLTTVRYGGESKTLSVLGVADTFRTIRNVSIEAGRFLSEHDVASSRKVVVLGSKLCDDLLGTTGRKGREAAIGRTVEIGGQGFTVVGVTGEEKPGLVTTQEVSGYSVFLPYTAVWRLTGNEDIPLLFAAAERRGYVKQVTEHIKGMLDRKYGTGRFEVQNLEAAIEAVGHVTTTMTVVVGGIAAIALLVGGIGIMNIMLVSVTERTKEIGLRKALGAARPQILGQFLTEAVVLSGCGGLVGIAVGAGLARIASWIWNLPSLVSWTSVVVGFGFSVVVGVVFGVYPASKASRMDPIEALRHE
ncbi:MAG TPA: FtsX-like permease family protein [Clostridia bacterium]|nr:FtsX-like permease family protein [Clostridia bacterium]